MKVLKTIKRDLRLVEHVVINCVQFVVGIVVKFPLTLFTIASVILLMLAVGILLVIFRILFLLLIPVIIIVTNDLVWYLNLISKVAKKIINIIITFEDDFVDALDDVLDYFNIDLHLHGASKIVWGVLDDSAFVTELQFIRRTCGPYDNISIIGQWVVYALFNDQTCPLVRYTYPLPWLHTTLHTLIGWTYRGDAVPALRPTDAEYGNCNWKFDQQAEGVCVALGAGVIINEVLVPLVFFGALFVAIGGPSGRLVGNAFSAATRAIYRTFVLSRYLERLFMRLLDA
jgi:hypothetical protein